MPVVSVVQATRLGVGTNQSDGLIPPTQNIKYPHLSVALQDPRVLHLDG